MLRRFLSFVVEETLAGRGEALTQYAIGYQVFGFGPDFDPDTNAVVRVNANRLRRALENYYRASVQAEPVMITMPPGRYLLSISYGRRSASKPRSSPAVPSLALVEFEGIGLVKPWKQFPLLITEELGVSLGGMPQLRLLGPFPREEWETVKQQLLEAGNDQPLDFIISGSVNQVDDELLIHTRLLEGATSLAIWSDLHRCPLDTLNLSEVEEVLIRRIRNEVIEELGVAEHGDDSWASSA